VRLSSAEIVVADTGDTGPDPARAELGRHADVFIVDATGRYRHRAGDRHRPSDEPDGP
jgi:ribonuclease BN (tRNA processing enzyme)